MNLVWFGKKRDAGGALVMLVMVLPNFVCVSIYNSRKWLATSLHCLYLMTIEATHVFHSRKLNAINYTKEKLEQQRQQSVWPPKTNTLFCLCIRQRKPNKCFQLGTSHRNANLTAILGFSFSYNIYIYRIHSDEITANIYK